MLERGAPQALYTMCECADTRLAVAQCGGLSGLLQQALLAVEAGNVEALRMSHLVLTNALRIRDIESVVCIAELFLLSNLLFALLVRVQYSDLGAQHIALQICLALMRNLADGVCECLHAESLLPRTLSLLAKSEHAAAPGVVGECMRLVCGPGGALARTRFYTPKFCKALRIRYKRYMP